MEQINSRTKEGTNNQMSKLIDKQKRLNNWKRGQQQQQKKAKDTSHNEQTKERTNTYELANNQKQTWLKYKKKWSEAKKKVASFSFTSSNLDLLLLHAHVAIW